MKLTDLTIEQIFRAGVVHGMLTRAEDERNAIFGGHEVMQKIVKKNIFEEFARKAPETAADYQKTMMLLFGT